MQETAGGATVKDGPKRGNSMDPVNRIIAYHQASKHCFDRPADGPGYLDWANQPDPFRRYRGAPLLPLERPVPGGVPDYEAVFVEGHTDAVPVTRTSVSQLLFDSLAVSAWKQLGGTRWALRVNPSSGNLHPTEAYLLSGPIKDLSSTPLLTHYAPREHALEQRAALPPDLWRRLTLEFPDDTLFIGLGSVLWREAWKYGERAYRYCQHDIGHAIAAISVAAAAQGWRVRLLDGWSHRELGMLLGLTGADPDEPEAPDCLLAIMTQPGAATARAPGNLADWLDGASWQGQPNRLSRDHVDWPRLAEAERLGRKPPTDGRYPGAPPVLPPVSTGHAGFGIRPLIHRRRSAVDMDGRSAITAEAFYQILRKCLPGSGQVPFTSLPWPPQIHLVLFVHRVGGLDPGMYLLLRDPVAEPGLRVTLADGFAWERPDPAPDGLPLYRLRRGDTRELAAQLSCQQPIAANGCFAVAMLARFEPALRETGAWFYPRLFWEAGLIGQQLYLEAYASGVAATGIGCYFDDPVHELLGIDGLAYQVLYHFTVGAAVDDPRLTTLPAYPAPEGWMRDGTDQAGGRTV